jgi:hypothetical protein
MRSGRMGRRLVATAGMGAIIAMGVLSACAREEAPAPEKVTVTQTVTETAAPPAMPAPPPAAPVPAEKSINPTGGNLFTPPVIAPGPPTPAPGNLPGNK